MKVSGAIPAQAVWLVWTTVDGEQELASIHRTRLHADIAAEAYGPACVRVSTADLVD